MNHSITHTFVLVRDQDEALDFYTGPVGLEVRNDVQLDIMRWLTVGSPAQPEMDLGLMAVGPPIPPADQETMRQLLAKGSMPAVIFRTDDCDATFERLLAAGAEAAQEPVDQPYGVRDCAVRDPSGNHLRFSQLLRG